MIKLRKIIAAMLSMILFCGCGGTSAQKMEVTYFAMDTVMSFRVLGNNAAAEAAFAGLGGMLGKYEKKWSVTDPESVIAAANRGESVVLDPQTAELIQFALEMNELTDGALDITMYPVLREWGFTTGEYKVPDDDRIAELLMLTGCEKVQLSDSVLSLADGAQIDLGAVAKGYAGDLISEHFRECGVTSALLDLGGNIHTIGSNPDGTPWRLGIRSPFGEGNIAVLELSDKAAVTSGGYERYFTENGVDHSHILDPKTGAPADSGLVSVTIVGAEGRLCDALSTALYVMGAEAAERLWQEQGGFDMILIESNGDMLITEGLENMLVPADAFNGELVVLRNKALLD